VRRVESSVNTPKRPGSRTSWVTLKHGEPSVLVVSVPTEARQLYNVLILSDAQVSPRLGSKHYHGKESTIERLAPGRDLIVLFGQNLGFVSLSAAVVLRQKA
jgi:hypothetical protein